MSNPPEKWRTKMHKVHRLRQDSLRTETQVAKARNADWNVTRPRTRKNRVGEARCQTDRGRGRERGRYPSEMSLSSTKPSVTDNLIVRKTPLRA